MPIAESAHETNVIDFTCERWADVKGARGYEVSNLGRIRRYASDGKVIPVQCLLHPGGHLYFITQQKPCWRKLHRCVAQAFLGPPPPGRRVCRHLDDIPTNNRVANLAWGTHKDNAADRRVNGRENYSCKLTMKEALQLRKEWARKSLSQSVLAERYGVSQPAVSMIVNARSRIDCPNYSPGSTRPREKLTASDVRMIRQMHADGDTQKHIAILFAVNQATISKIVRRKRRKDV